MFRRQLGKHATLRVDDEKRFQGGDGWTHSGRGILNQAPAPCRAVVSPDPGGSGARGSGWKVCDEAFWGL
jgi:hypothetical protein